MVGSARVSPFSRVLKEFATEPSMKQQEEAEDGTPVDAALRIAAGGLTDLLFYSYGMLIVALAIVWLLLKHLGVL